MQKQPFALNKNQSIIMQIAVFALVLCGLYFTSLYSYILFHSLIEIFSVIITSCIFIIAWNSRRFLDNNYFLFIGVAFLFITTIDIAHTLAYKGMGVFQGYDANLPTQLWIAMRYMVAISFMIAPLTINRKMKVAPVFVVYALLTVLLFLSIFYWTIFPDCFIEGKGLTPFKIVSEYVICLILLGSIALLFYQRKTFDSNVFRLLVASIILGILAEFAFTTYVSVYGFANLVGHILICISFYLVYKAIIETGLTKPYDLLFRNLKQSEEELRTLSLVDELTGLYNRRGFLTIGGKLIKINYRTKEELLLFFADLDGMKRINDKFGHNEGDLALTEIANILKGTFRESDIIGRIGGDEFAVLATATQQDYSKFIINRLKEHLDINNAKGKHEYKLSLSIGVTSCPESPCSIEDMLNRADQLMYEQKKAKNNNRI
ncbi:MAG: GGDEF domain-containing protein [Dehalococcoidia bacterium]|nr:GGDEF domain-containing protein [Dehalococcoidia bacterium]